MHPSQLLNRCLSRECAFGTRTLSARVYSRNPFLRDNTRLFLPKWLSLLDLWGKSISHSPKHYNHTPHHRIRASIHKQVPATRFCFLGSCCRFLGSLYHPSKHPGTAAALNLTSFPLLQTPTNPPKSSRQVNRTTLCVRCDIPDRWLSCQTLYDRHRGW